MDIESVREDVQEIKGTVNNIYKVLNGNGAMGLVTKTALNEQSVKRLWWFVGAIALSILGSAIYFIRVGVT